MAKTKALNSVAVTAKLICVFVFAYAKIRFSHVGAHIRIEPCHEKNLHFAYAKTKAQISFAVTAQLVSAFVFAT